MHRPDLPRRIGLVLLLALVTFFIGYPGPGERMVENVR